MPTEPKGLKVKKVLQEQIDVSYVCEINSGKKGIGIKKKGQWVTIAIN